VKDILRWRSFRNKDRKSPPSDSPETSATTAVTTSGSASSKGEESDFSFTAEELPRWWCGEDKRRSGEVDVDVVEGGDLVRERTGARHVSEMGHEEVRPFISCFFPSFFVFENLVHFFGFIRHWRSHFGGIN